MTISGQRVDHVVDTVGAGDGFAVGVITGLLEGIDIKSAVARGNIIGRLQYSPLVIMMDIQTELS